ncbi:uncharacterized protein LTR77_010621 [Saxophila tyrrhenica]|uniref:Major facilitator superfamily (MFS) profile domain-containing protein n=1 Tax=Saxophila tyrrhenica TaxID=1690608 RepID=A0AAV9NYP8_9PEZI|nr:hypothetical protein LTR77_010621 [Saxophila tyrrhenica]
MATVEMHSHYMGLAGTALQTAIAVAAGLSFVAFGYGQGDVGGLIVESTFMNYFPSFETPIYAGSVIATWNIGCFVGAFFTIFLGDRLGRKGTVVTGLICETIGKIIQCSSFGIGQYVAGRMIAGIGNGFVASGVPAYQAECLKTHRRGTLLLVSFGSCITLGNAIAYWIVYAFSFTQPSSAAWRVPIILAAMFTLPALLVIVFMPESPRWLLLKGREQEAMNVLSALNELPIDHEDTRREILQIKYAVKHMASSAPGQVFTNGEYRYLQRTLLAVGLQIMQQFTGVNIFIQYLAAMFVNQLRYANRVSMVLAACCSTEFFLASVGVVFVIDRFWGRRDLTIFGASGMCFCMVMLTIFNWLGLENGEPWAFKVMTAFLFLYLTFFAIGWQGMSWMWAVELVPLSIRGPANAMSTAANWLSNFVVVLVTPVMFDDITWRTYVVFAVTNFCFIPVIYIFYPETGARSLEEVDIVFKSASQRGNPWLSAVKAAKEEPKWYDKNGEPTDSYGGSEKDDIEKGMATSSGDNSSSPERMFNAQPVQPRRTSMEPRFSDEGWHDHVAAPAPSIRRTHSSQ